MNIWTCKIGDPNQLCLPTNADHPMRKAVVQAYRELTGKDPEFVFSGWGGELSESEHETINEHRAKTTSKNSAEGAG